MYTPGDLMKLADQHRQIGELEEELRHTTPDWASQDGPVGGSREGQPARMDRASSRRSRTSRPAAQRYLPQADGRFLAQGYAPTKHDVKLTAMVAARSITAFRLELLTDPNLPLGGPGRSFKGTNALTEFRVDAAAADDEAKPARVKFAKASADFGDPPDSPLEPNFDDKSGKKRVTGPVGFAIDDKDDTAWGIDAGPGRRNAPRKAVFTLETPIAYEKGAQLIFLLKQNHGGWNSDDLMTNNLGRFRLSVHGGDGPGRRPAADGRARDPVDPARETVARADARRSSASGARPSPSSRTPTRGSRPSAGSTRNRRRRRWSSRPAARCARRTCSSAATG